MVLSWTFVSRWIFLSSELVRGDRDRMELESVVEAEASLLAVETELERGVSALLRMLLLELMGLRFGGWLGRFLV